jgi:hypothetical protein
MTIQKVEKVAPCTEQKEMLMMSDLDIENGNVVPESELDNDDCNKFCIKL